MEPAHFTDIALDVDGTHHEVRVDNRVTLLDLLREHLGVTAPKKGCDHGQCGSCTVLLDGRRATTCLAFAVLHDGAEIVTAAGLGDADALHPVAQAFLEHDGFQCGYCTPGQICSAVGMLDEVKAGASHADIPDIDAIWLDSVDEHSNPMGSRGAGEIGIVGSAAAVVNAVYHATGVRVRDLPVTCDALLT